MNFFREKNVNTEWLVNQNSQQSHAREHLWDPASAAAVAAAPTTV